MRPPTHHRTRRTTEQEVALFAEMLAGLDQKASASVSLLSSEPWDLFITVFGEAHCVGHQFWHLHDVDHPWFEARWLDALGVDDPVRAVYRKLDGVLADHLAVVPDDATVIVLLSHGTARWRGGVHCLDPILHRLELARTGRPVPTVGPRSRQLAGALAMVPQRWRRRSATLAGRMFAPRLDGREVPRRRHRAAPDRRWFAVRNNSHTAALRLNVIGREGAGVVDSASMGEELAWLDDRLREIVDVTTGRPAVADVVRSSDLYHHDPVHHQLADLLVEWQGDGPLERLWSPTMGHLHVPAETWRSGDHDPEGVMYVASPDAAPLEAQISAVDVAAVISRSVGLMATPGGA
jgi:predicted AlkP superfamily phosphohydrolase/phosphomutase